MKNKILILIGLVIILYFISYFIFKKEIFAPAFKNEIDKNEKIIIEKYNNLELNKIKQKINQELNEQNNIATTTNFKGPNIAPYIIGPSNPPPQN
jgi:hypothetical protein